MNRAPHRPRLAHLACAALALLVGTAPARADDDTPTGHARQLLARQLASDLDAAGPPAVAADALVISRTATASGGPGELAAARGSKPLIGATADAAWVVADLTQLDVMVYDCPPALARCHPKRPVRLSELVVKTPKGWQVVAAHVQARAKGGGAEPDALPATTAAGPLTAWLVDPAALDAALANDANVVVLGTEPGERAVGKKAAHKLLGGWRKLKLSIAGAPREVHGARWAYAAANVDWTRKPDDVIHMRATVFATSTDGTTWTAVVAHYSLAAYEE